MVFGYFRCPIMQPNLDTKFDQELILGLVRHFWIPVFKNCSTKFSEARFGVLMHLLSQMNSPASLNSEKTLLHLGSSYDSHSQMQFHAFRLWKQNIRSTEASRPTTASWIQVSRAKIYRAIKVLNSHTVSVGPYVGTLWTRQCVWSWFAPIFKNVISYRALIFKYAFLTQLRFLEWILLSDTLGGWAVTQDLQVLAWDQEDKVVEQRWHHGSYAGIGSHLIVRFVGLYRGRVSGNHALRSRIPVFENCSIDVFRFDICDRSRSIRVGYPQQWHF